MFLKEVPAPLYVTRKIHIRPMLWEANASPSLPRNHIHIPSPQGSGFCILYIPIPFGGPSIACVLLGGSLYDLTRSAGFLFKVLTPSSRQFPARLTSLLRMPCGGKPTRSVPVGILDSHYGTGPSNLLRGIS